jgi:hypothetical protein
MYLITGNAPDSENDALFSILVVIFAIFLCELAILSWTQRGYRFSFFFWMDFIGTISILFDVEWIFGQTLARSNVSVLRTTRIARIGARYQRLIRLLKLFRDSTFWPWNQDNDEKVVEPSLSSVRRVSRELSSVLSIRVAALVIIIAIILPFLSYIFIDFSADAWIQSTLPLIAASCAISPTSTPLTTSDLDTIATNINNFYRGKDEKLFSVFVDTPWISPASNFYQTYNPYHRNIRDDAKYTYTESFTCASAPDPNQEYNMEIVLNFTLPNQQDALYGIILIIVVIILLFIFSASFNTAVNDLVVNVSPLSCHDMPYLTTTL